MVGMSIIEDRNTDETNILCYVIVTLHKYMLFF